MASPYHMHGLTLTLEEAAGEGKESAPALDTFVLNNPSPAAIRKEGSLGKRCQVKDSYKWLDRWVILTDDSLLLGDAETRELRDALRLGNLTRVIEKGPAHENAGETHNSSFRSMLQDALTPTDTSMPSNSLSTPVGGYETLANSSSRDSTLRVVTKSTSTLIKSTSRDVNVGLDCMIELVSEAYGRTYYLKADSPEDCHEWVMAIMEAKEAAAAVTRLGQTPWTQLRAKLRHVYHHRNTQICIAVQCVCVCVCV